MMITGIYAALLGLLLAVLSLRVIGLRGNPVFKFMAFRNLGDDTLQRAIRGHGNLAEFAPLMLIMLLIAEMNGASPTVLHSYGSVFFIGRLAHGICFGFMQRSMLLRVGGIALTLTALIGMAAYLLRTSF